MKKPTKKSKNPVFNWCEMEQYIKELTGKDIRDWQGKFEFKNDKLIKCNDDYEYQDFWHLICDRNDIHNGCYIYLDKNYYTDIECNKSWQIEIATLIFNEFDTDNTGELKFWIEW